MAAAFFGMLMTGTLLLSGMEMQVSAQTIRHEHLGDAQNGGECFADAVYHVHEGNEEEGGSCYNPSCCREKRQRRSLKTIQREIIVQETVRF